MSDLASVVVRGERARLFPVLADTSKEGRTLSILLACIENVDEFGRALLAELIQILFGLIIPVRAVLMTVNVNGKPCQTGFL